MALLPALVAGCLFAFGQELIRRVAWGSCRFLACELPRGCRGPASANASGLQVILPSVGQTGTSSVTLALAQMGFRSYHDEEKTVFSPFLAVDAESPAHFAEGASRCRMEALSLEPQVDLLPHALRTSPEAKFIMTWRDYPSWLASATFSYSKNEEWRHFLWFLMPSYSLLPWAYWYDAVAGGLSDLISKGEPFVGRGRASLAAYVALKNHRTFDSPLHNTDSRGSFKILFQEEAYLAHVDEIRRFVPPGRMLDFDVRRHGWEELARFLGRPAPPPGTAFPRVRGKE